GPEAPGWPAPLAGGPDEGLDPSPIAVGGLPSQHAPDFVKFADLGPAIGAAPEHVHIGRRPAVIAREVHEVFRHRHGCSPDAYSGLILSRSHALACGRLEGWRHVRNLWPSFETRRARARRSSGWRPVLLHIRTITHPTPGRGRPDWRCGRRGA